MKYYQSVWVCAVAGLFVANPAAMSQVSVIDFGTVAVANLPYGEDGYTLSPLPTNGDPWYGNAGAQRRDLGSDGDTELSFFSNSVSQEGAWNVALTEDTASLFSLLTIDVESASVSQGVPSIGTFIITSDKGGSFDVWDAWFSGTSSPFTIDFNSAAQVGDVTLWDDVSAITFNYRDNGFGSPEIYFDNINVFVPAPGAAGLLGLGGLMATRRRRN